MRNKTKINEEFYQNSYHLYLRNAKKIDFSLIGRLISGGSEGDVFEYNKKYILKITNYPIGCKQEMKSILKQITTKKYSFISKIIDYGFFKIPSNHYIGDYENYGYWYIAEKLYPIKDRTKIDSYLSKLNIKAEKNNLYFNDDHSDNILQTKNGTIKICDIGALNL